MVAVSSAVVLSAGCGSGEKAFPEEFAEQVQADQGTGQVVLPGSRPPELMDAWVTRLEDASAVSFYSGNTPIVMVCTGDAGQCRSTYPDAAGVRAEQVDGRDVVVLLGRSDDPEAADVPLPAELDDFWSGVELTADEPEWLEQ